MDKLISIDLEEDIPEDNSTEGIVQDLNRKEKKRQKQVFLKAELRLREAKIHYNEMDAGEKAIFNKAKDFLDKKKWLPRSYRGMLKTMVEKYEGKGIRDV